MALRLKDDRRTTSDVLLHKLREGQEELRRSVRVLNQSISWRKREEKGGKRRREKDELAVHRYTGGRGGRGPLDCVDNLPRKRARLLQLSPTTSVSSIKTNLWCGGSVGIPWKGTIWSTAEVQMSAGAQVAVSLVSVPGVWFRDYRVPHEWGGRLSTQYDVQCTGVLY